MAGGTPEMAEVPLVYRVRHVRPRMKQAQVSTVVETSVVRLASWSADEAPAAGTLRTTRDDIVRYRAARGADGEVRLVAPVASRAFSQGNLSAGPFGFPDPSRAGNGPEVDAGDALGEILVSEKAAAQARMSARARRFVLVDGELHASCRPPGWILDYDRTLAPEDRILRRACACPDLDSCHSEDLIEDFMPHAANPARKLAAMFPATPGTPKLLGSIAEEIEDAFAMDTAWRGLRGKLSWTLWNDHGVDRMMFEEESRLRHSLVAACSDWPDARVPGLAASAVRMARIVHGIRSNGNAGLVAHVAAAAAAVEATSAPRPLEARLASAGVAVPRAGDAPGPGGPRM